MNKQKRPVRNLKELAVEFKVTSNFLRGLIAHDETFPKPVIAKGVRVFKFNMLNSKTRYGLYDHADMQAWWKKRQEAKGEK